MGAFFTNIQLRISDTGKSGITDRVVEYIIKLNAEAGFSMVDDEEQADKSIIISPSDDLTWVSIYDEDTEDQNLKRLNKIASGLSEEFKTIALSILVNDSDTFYVGLINNGTLKDNISNRSKKPDFSKNKPLVWSDILANNYSFDDIKKAWQNKSVFVEDFLRQFAKLIDIDSSRLITGYNYTNEADPAKEVKLNFIKNDSIPAELGLTKFRMLAGAGLIDVKGGEKQTGEWIVTNQGNSSEGLDVIVAGECITNELLIPESVTVSLSGYRNERNTQFSPTLSTAGERIFYAKIEDYEIPKGYQPRYPMTPKESKRYDMIQYQCGINFNITFIGGKEGTGELTIFFSPLVNRQEGGDYMDSMKGTLEEWKKKNNL